MKNLFAFLSVLIMLALSRTAAHAEEQFSFSWKTIVSVKLTPYPDNQVGLELTFPLEVAYRFSKFTEANVGKQVTLLFNDKVVFQPIVKEKTSGTSWTFTTNNFDAAITLLRYLHPDS